MSFLRRMTTVLVLILSVSSILIFGLSFNYPRLAWMVYFFSFLAIIVYLRVSLKEYLNRIRKTALKIEEMAAGSLSKLIDVKKSDEIGQIENALNDLIARLKTGVAISVSTHRELAQAKSDFVSMASHELRTPISIIKWYIDYVRSEDAGPLTKEQKEYLEKAYESNERIIELINALLDVSRIDLGTFSIEPKPTDVNVKAEEAIEKFLPMLIKKEIKLEKSFDKMPMLSLDPRLIRIVLENILSNSIKYTPEKGRVKFEIKKTDSNMLIKIADNGLGISREMRPKIFSKMFRADNAKKMVAGGTGLGLYIAKAVIEKSGGRIWFESPSLEILLDEEKNNPKIIANKNKGTTFFITIPLRGMKEKRGTKKLESIE